MNIATLFCAQRTHKQNVYRILKILVEKNVDPFLANMSSSIFATDQVESRTKPQHLFIYCVLHRSYSASQSMDYNISFSLTNM